MTWKKRMSAAAEWVVLVFSYPVYDRPYLLVPLMLVVMAAGAIGMQFLENPKLRKRCDVGKARLEQVAKHIRRSSHGQNIEMTMTPSGDCPTRLIVQVKEVRP
jgi:hypothetical protein